MRDGLLCSAKTRKDTDGEEEMRKNHAKEEPVGRERETW